MYSYADQKKIKYLSTQITFGVIRNIYSIGESLKAFKINQANWENDNTGRLKQRKQKYLKKTGAVT